jgi:hypothetical protein
MNRTLHKAPLLLFGMMLVSCAGISNAVGLKNSLPVPQPTNANTWYFAVSGDSRNCGDIAVPTIAQKVNGSQAQFYWHLGDFRAIYTFDEDMQRRPSAGPMTMPEYQQRAWDDFIGNQISRFTVPVFLGIGNHETILPKTRADYLTQFAEWLNAPAIKEQRLRDDPRDQTAKSYYHWVQNGVDFINLDNATVDQFDDAQMTWVKGILQRDAANSDIKAVVVGMHKALPDSIAANHSMNESPTGVQSGRRLYADLLDLQNSRHKHVYVLASHSHYFMDGIFKTDYCRTHGGVLPGWIIGTAGAVRYALPGNATDANKAKTNVYGYLLAAVDSAGAIQFDFKEIQESDVPAGVVQQMGQDLIHQCFQKNSQPH